MRIVETLDGRERELKAQLIRAAKLLLEHSPDDGFSLHFDAGGERQYVVCGSSESVAVLSRQLSD